MAQVNWTEPDFLEIDEIASYIDLDKLSAAEKLVKEIFATVDRLEQFPDSGRTPPELEKTQYQEVIVGPCRIFYRVHENSVYIIHVMRSERKLRRLILDARANNDT